MTTQAEGFGSAIGMALPSIRSFAESLMVDACLIRRVSGTTTDPDTLQTQDTYTNVYVGKCRVRQPNAEAASPEVGEAVRVLQRLTLSVPFATTGIRVGDEVIITDSRDPDMVDRLFVIVAGFNQTDASARRFGCEERLA